MSNTLSLNPILLDAMAAVRKPGLDSAPQQLPSPSEHSTGSLNFDSIKLGPRNNIKFHEAYNATVMLSGANQFSGKTDKEVAQTLRNNFDAFEDPNNPGTISQKMLRNMANNQLTGNYADDQNIMLAREILNRPDLNKLLDQDSETGKQDGLIHKENTEIAANGGNPLSGKSDQKVAEEMLKNFDKLKDDYWTSSIKVDTLKDISKRSLTGNADKDRLTHIAREVLSRPELLKKLDNIYSKDGDGWIRWEALEYMKD